MADQDQTKKEEATRQGGKEAATEPAAEAIQRDAGRAATASRQTSTASENARMESAPTATGAVDRTERFGSRMDNAVSSTLTSVGAAGGAIGVTRDVLKNVIEATEDVGSNLVGGVRHLATDVVTGVGDVGGSAVHTLTDLLVDVVGGVKTVVSEVLPRGTRADRMFGGGEARRPAGEMRSDEASVSAAQADRTRAEEAVH